MSKLEYLNPSDWSLHVIDGENDCVPEGWVLVPESSNYLTLSPRMELTFWVGENTCWNESSKNWMDTTKYSSACFDNSYYDYWKNKTVWTRKMKEYLVERDGKYELVEAYHLDGGVEVPNKADCLTKVHGFLTFWDGDFKSKTIGHLDFWCDSEKHPNLFFKQERIF